MLVILPRLNCTQLYTVYCICRRGRGYLAGLFSPISHPVVLIYQWILYFLSNILCLCWLAKEDKEGGNRRKLQGLEPEIVPMIDSRGSKGWMRADCLDGQDPELTNSSQSLTLFAERFLVSRSNNKSADSKFF